MPPSLLRGVDRAGFAAALTDALRTAGVRCGPHATVRFVDGLQLTQPVTRLELYWLARVTLVSDVRDLEIFDRLFDVVFEGGALPTGRDARKSQKHQPPPALGDSHHSLTKRTEAPGSVGGVPWTSTPSVGEDDDQVAEESEIELPELLPAELSAVVDVPFSALSDADLARIGAWLEAILVRWPTRPARRFEPAARGKAIDARATLRASMRSGGVPMRLERRRLRQRPRRVVMLADVSGSMQSFVRPYLHVMRALAAHADAEVFAFATQLTRITPALRHTDPHVAVEEAAELVDDRFSGTRIASSVGQLLAHPTWSTMVRGATILVASDGWDTDSADDLDARMARLNRMAHRIVWINPRAAADDWQPLVAGMAAALPHCSTVLSGHSLLAMRDVLHALAASGARAAQGT